MWLWALLLGWAGAPAWADHSLHDALDHAWERAVSVHLAQARHGLAEASQAAADSWLPQPPSLGISEKSDRFHERRGEREREIELALPLWLPGQREAHRTLAAKDSAAAEAAVAAARLHIAGELRTTIWNLATDRAEWEIATQRLATAEKLEAEVARRVQAGDLARADLLLAQEEALAARSAAAEAATREHQALERYRVLTGFDHLPAVFDEAVARASETPHPRLRLALAAVERARAQMQVTREDRREPPEISLGIVRARSEPAAPKFDTVRIGLRIPFASAARNAPKIAAANAELIRAEAEHRQTAAEVESEERAALAALDSARTIQQAAQTRAGLATERLALQEKAFVLGELGLAEFMRVRAAANEAHLDLRRATLAFAAAQARINQARGILP